MARSQTEPLGFFNASLYQEVQATVLALWGIFRSHNTGLLRRNHASAVVFNFEPVILIDEK